MQLVFSNSKGLLKALKAVRPFKKATSAAPPILEGVLLATGLCSVDITATDLASRLSVAVDCAIETPGEAVVSHSQLEKTISALPKTSEITLVAEPDGLTVLCGRLTNTLRTMSASAYPEFYRLSDRNRLHGISIAAPLLSDALKKTYWASDELKGVNLQVPGGDELSTLVVTATDGHRVARVADMPISLLTSPNALNVSIDASVASALIKAFGDEGDIEMSVHEGSEKVLVVRFKTRPLLLDTVACTFEYPVKIEQLYSETQGDSRFRYEVDSAELIGLCNWALVSASSNKMVVFSFPGEGIEISASDGDRGSSARVALPAKRIASPSGRRVEGTFPSDQGSSAAEKPSGDIALNGQYLLDALKHFESEVVVLNFGDPKTLMSLSDEGSYTYLCMSMQIK